MRHNCAFLIVSFLFLFRISFAQEPSYNHYTVRDGLVQMQVTIIFQDSKSYLWIGTKGGVSRFDGISFMNLTPGDGLMGNQVFSISEDKAGNIWFLSSLGFSKYNGSSIETFPTNATQGVQLNHPIHLSGDSLILFTTKDSIIFEWLFSEGVYSKEREIAVPISGNSPNLIVNHVSDGSGQINWFLFDKAGIFRVDRESIFMLDNTPGKYKRLFRGNDGNIYAVSKKALYQLVDDSLKFVQNIPGIYPREHEIQIAVNSKNEPGLISDLDLQLMIQSNGEYIHLDVNNLPHSYLYYDKEDNLWVGGENGLIKIIPTGILNFLPSRSSMNEKIWSVVEGPEGEMLFCSYIDGIQKYEDGVFKSIVELSKIADPTEVRMYMGSIKDSSGNAWLAASNPGVIKYDGNNLSLIKGLPFSTTIFILRMDKDNQTILGGGNGTFYKFRHDSLLFVYPAKPGNGKSTAITGLTPDKFGRYWLGGFNGISIFNNDSLIHLPTNEFPFDLGGNAIFRDYKQNLWIGNPKGLFFYDYNEFRQIDHPFLRNFISTIESSGDTALFVGSLKGLAFLDLNSFYEDDRISVLQIGADKGFFGIEPGQNGFYKDSEGALWLPCADRVVRINPRLIKPNLNTPEVYITDLHLLNSEMKWKKVPYLNNTPVKFSYSKDEKNIRFDFIGISLLHPEGVSYSYLLEGYDKGWSQPLKERSAVYTNLEPGEYRFLVKASNADGFWTENPAEIRFVIEPGLWQLLWFKISAASLIALLMLITGAYLMHRRRKKQQEQFNREKRITELNLLTIKNQIDPHFTYNAINTIAAAVLKEEKNTAYHYFVKLSQLMRSIVQDNDKLTRSLEEELSFVRDFLDIQMYRFRDRFSYDITISNESDLLTDVPKMCIQTYAENALKHGLMQKAEVGTIKINISGTPDVLEIVVEDDGIGRQRAMEIKTRGTGKGLSLQERYYDYFNRQNKKKIRWEIIDKTDAQGNSTGTKVIISIPRNFTYTHH